MNSAPRSLPLVQSLRPRWDCIDHVLLDMDGTLLDLRFDNYFWRELVPQRFAARRGLTLEAARQELTPRFAARQGTLDWYCTDFWTRELDLDIAALKREVREQVCFLPGAERFLAQLRRRAVQVVLLTNAHADSLNVKAGQTNLTRYFDAVISSHQYGAPKETPQFWSQAQQQLQFDAARSLFVDDSLAVLRSARQHGIAQIFAISKPDSTQDQRQIAEFPSVSAIVDLLD
ncbi:MAG TPA: GMP/IMP nucleotidase [Povalibacter sp.]|nr:GMP/IMP nucleotidase [Povalibacter sp.]